MKPFKFKSLVILPFTAFVLLLLGLSGIGHITKSGLFLPSQVVSKLVGGHNYHDVYKEEDRSKLIKFSHAYHKTEVGAECAQCHSGVEKSTKSTDNNLGLMEDCYACHDKKKTDCSVCHMEKSEPYSAFANPKRELVFSHKQHIDAGSKCEDCHTNVGEKGYVNTSFLPTMESCMGCHNGVKASNDCQTCHTDIRFIKPADHVGDFMRTHKQIVATQGDVNCVMCHSSETCEECHEGGNLEKFKKHNDFTTSKGASGVNGNNSMILQRSHSLDYLFTHRFDAKAKTSDCQSCHETETFCVQCHTQNPKVSKPAGHDAAGFVNFTAGSGGGLHASLAKKDMENCVSCHELETGDVTCLQCHTNDGKRR
ncbi:cytochrome c3 family protein [bacterium]|nr:cytochrome c3 family protein [bacterium]